MNIKLKKIFILYIMSNTNYITYNPNSKKNEDLSAIFLPITSGVTGTVTNYKVTDGSDLNTKFASITSPGAVNIGFDTGFKISNGTDLRNVFASINSNKAFTTTSQLITTTTSTNINTTILTSNFYLTGTYKYFNFILYGAGGSGRQPPDSPSYGGAGSGGYISALKIPYNPSSDIIISSILYSIGGGGDEYDSNIATIITINYSNGTQIVLNAGCGSSPKTNSGNTGAAGGVNTTSNNTSFYSNTNITAVNGAKGGDINKTGTSSGYTSSGSGNSGLDSAPVGNPPTVSKTYNTPDGKSYTINSAGGGKSQVVSGYGAGGAATPANYNKNALAYRYGSPGCILYYLST